MLTPLILSTNAYGKQEHILLIVHQSF